MSYQSSLFDFATMQDRSGTTSGHLRLPPGMTRGDCVEAGAARARGEQSCPFLTCKYHLVPELTRIRPKGAENAMLRRWEGEIKHTCVLDLTAIPGLEWSRDSATQQDHYAIADALGIDRAHVAQRESEAMHKFRFAMKMNDRSCK
jgi:hypothetical protein